MQQCTHCAELVPRGILMMQHMMSQHLRGCSVVLRRVGDKGTKVAKKKFRGRPLSRTDRKPSNSSSSPAWLSWLPSNWTYDADCVLTGERRPIWLCFPSVLSVMCGSQRWNYFSLANISHNAPADWNFGLICRSFMSVKSVGVAGVRTKSDVTVNVRRAPCVPKICRISPLFSWSKIVKADRNRGSLLSVVCLVVWAYWLAFISVFYRYLLSASKMTYIVFGGALNSTHSLLLCAVSISHMWRTAPI